MENFDFSQQFYALTSVGKPSAGICKLLQKFNLPENDIDAIVTATQKEWLRTPGKERWDAQDPYAARKDELLPFFKEAGVVGEVKPQAKEFDYAIIMGAFMPRMQVRIEHTKKLWNEGYRFKQIVLLGAERALVPQQEFIETFGRAPVPQTEYEMIQWVYAHADLPHEMKQVKTTFINTPNTIDANGQIMRAKTGDTIKAWLATNPKPGTCLIISNQPQAYYYPAVARTLLPETFKVAQTACALNENARICEILDALARWVYQENELLKKQSKTHEIK